MPVNFSSSYTQRQYYYTQWKTAWILRGGVPQADSSDGVYQKVWFYDGPEIHYCFMWLDGYEVTDPNYSQTQNDADLADFTSYVSSYCNVAIIPKTADGRESQLPNLLPTGTQLCFPGAGDDPTLGIGAGTLFQHASDDDGYGLTTHSITWQFNDWVYLSGGHIVYSSAEFGDTVDYSISAPATTVSGVSGTGNVNLVSSVVIIPGENTNYEVNLSNAVPVPSLTNTGYWNWTPATNGVGPGTITPNLTGTGAFNLYAIPITLGNFVINYPMLGDNYIDLTVPAILPKKLLPQWIHTVQVSNTGHNGLRLVWALTIARAITVGI